ncbi:MAG: TrkA family potassium uptake protein [Lachnospiraceae bacterium]|nr:TrkA family potassium uptake protein [Robinsoniella sp.]MDY3767157.1 TrkA family potassium uptake protein [Lachnospiraceae bacterium]
MAGKSFVVFGLGSFGNSVAVNLCQNGCEVLAIDVNEERVQNIADQVTYAVTGNVIDPAIYETMGIGDMDGAIVAISDHTEASIMATIQAKEAGIPYVLAKAKDPIHAKVLRKVGADHVIFPESEMGSRVAKNMVFGKFIDTFELSSDFSMVEMKVPSEWVGKTLKELDVRGRYKINIVGVRQGTQFHVVLDPDEPLQSDQVLLAVGNNEKLKKLT